jgi:uncharacterized cupin superfamily protein
MEPKEFDIEFPRGDTCPIKFNLVDKDGNTINLKEGDELYFTMKRTYNTHDYIVQKKYSRNEIIQEDGSCSFTLETGDTNTLNYGTYVYDISLRSGTYRKTLCLGQITLTNESTFVENE